MYRILADTECNVDKCLRKYKNSSTGEISRWCGVVSDKALEKIQPNNKKCPLYCDKFFCYQTEKITRKHENVYWISDEPMSDDYRKTYEIKAKDVKFSGLSKEGEEIRDNIYRHSNTKNIICPYCDHEINDVWECIDSSYNDYENIECPECEREFEVSIHREVTFSTSKIDK